MADDFADVPAADLAAREQEAWRKFKQAEAALLYSVTNPDGEAKAALRKAQDNAEAEWWTLRKAIKARIRAAVLLNLALSESDLDRYL